MVIMTIMALPPQKDLCREPAKWEIQKYNMPPPSIEETVLNPELSLTRD
jgi:hypothetical protein